MTSNFQVVVGSFPGTALLKSFRGLVKESVLVTRALSAFILIRVRVEFPKQTLADSHDLLVIIVRVFGSVLRLVRVAS